MAGGTVAALPGPLVLASASPRRRELLPLLGYPFEVVQPEVEEIRSGHPRDAVERNAELKARAGAELAPRGSVLIGADTDVLLEGELLGKPADAEAARERIEALAGRGHQVLSAVCVLPGSAPARAGIAETTVHFRDLSATEVDAYIASGEWEGRAGGYAVQGMGSSLVAMVEGDLSNVIGLPLPLVAELLGG